MKLLWERMAPKSNDRPSWMGQTYVKPRDIQTELRACGSTSAAPECEAGKAGQTSPELWQSHTQRCACVYLNPIYLFCLHIHLCTIYMPGIHRGQKRVSDPQEHELQTVISLCVGARNQTWVLQERSLLTAEPSLQPYRLYFFLLL